MKNKGFTLIELLVVIAIIGLLSTIVLVSLNQARAKARDSRRLADMQTIQKALEMYFDENGFYPKRNYAYVCSATGCGVNWCNLESDLSPYLKKVPRDPSSGISSYCYYYDSDDSDPDPSIGDNYQSYGLMVKMEDSGNYSKVSKDGGYYNWNGTYYEIGSQPAYCMAKYTLTNRNWWGLQTTVCVGGD